MQCFLRTASCAIIMNKSVKPTFVYLVEGCGRALTEITTYTLHTRHIWSAIRRWYHKYMHERQGYRSPSVCSYEHLKLPHFLQRTHENTFALCLSEWSDITNI